MIFLQVTFLLLLLAVPLLHADRCPMMHCPTHQITYSDELAMCHKKSGADWSNNFAEGIGSFIAMHVRSYPSGYSYSQLYIMHS